MPPPTLVDLSIVDFSKVPVGIEQIRQVNAHRHEFEMLDGIFYVNSAERSAVGFKQTSMQDFWVRGHIPGRPLMPGVLITEAAGQLCSYVYRTIVNREPGVFLGFAGLNNVKFRGAVNPGERLILIAKAREERHRRIVCDTQGLVNDRLVFEGEIIGMPV
ncbi:MAG: beta-hydroxyacyl-ACP dehydratase [Planctomycetia bacterium]|nr:beta-hydroxyacyl-ACP dehydratase [Planctomycetia bacterium]